MSKPVKNLITQTYQQKFGDLEGAVVIDIRGIASNTNNTLRAKLLSKHIKVTVVNNGLAARAVKGTKIERIAEILSGSCALAYPTNGDASVVSVARELIGMVKEIENLTFRGAILDGTLFGADEIEALSKYPTREEAQAQVVQIILTPAQKLVGAILGPGRKVASLVKAIEEKLEKGETIAKVA